MAEKTTFEVWAPKFMRLLMADFNLSIDDAAAIIGNAAHESGGFDKLQEISPVVKGSKGGWGIMQWTGPRRRAMEAYCKRNKLDPAAMMSNYKWLWMELSGHDGTNEHKVLPLVKQATSLEKKVEVFCYKFLRPGILHMNNRKAWARKAQHVYYAEIWLDEFTKEPAPQAAPEPETASVAKEPEPEYDPPVVQQETNTMLSGSKTYIVAGMVALIAVLEGFLGIDIPGADMQADWMNYILGALGLGALRMGMSK